MKIEPNVITPSSWRKWELVRPISTSKMHAWLLASMVSNSHSWNWVHKCLHQWLATHIVIWTSVKTTKKWVARFVQNQSSQWTRKSVYYRKVRPNNVDDPTYHRGVWPVWQALGPFFKKPSWYLSQSLVSKWTCDRQCILWKNVEHNFAFDKRVFIFEFISGTIQWYKSQLHKFMTKKKLITLGWRTSTTSLQLPNVVTKAPVGL